MKRGYVVGPLAVITIIIITTFLSSQAKALNEDWLFFEYNPVPEVSEDASISYTVNTVTWEVVNLYNNGNGQVTNLAYADPDETCDAYLWTWGWCNDENLIGSGNGFIVDNQAFASEGSGVKDFDTSFDLVFNDDQEYTQNLISQNQQIHEGLVSLYNYTSNTPLEYVSNQNAINHLMDFISEAEAENLVFYLGDSHEDNHSGLSTWEISELINKNLQNYQSNQSLNEIYETIISNPTLAYQEYGMEGLEEVHNQGWTGKGINIGVITQANDLDQTLNNIQTKFIAPGSTIDVQAVYGSFYFPIQNNQYDIVIHRNDRKLLDETQDAFQESLIIKDDRWGSDLRYSYDDVDKESVIFTTDLKTEPAYLYSSNQHIHENIRNHTLIVKENSTFNKASSQLAGVSALIMHKFGTDASTTKSILINTADNDFDGYDPVIHGVGQLDFGKALSPVGNLN